jgi:hypothetical protein
MERMIEHPPKRLPLKTHGYLRSVAYEICDDLDKQREVKKNKAERAGNPSSPSATPRQGISAEEMKKISDENYWKGRKK